MSESLRSFNQLTHADQLRAILAIIRNPITQLEAYTLAGIDPKKLDDGEMVALDGIFNGSDVVSSVEKTEAKYILDDKAKQKIAKTVDLESAEEQYLNFISSLGLIWAVADADQ